MRKIILAGILPCLALLGSCEYAPTTVERTISYNHAIAESTNELLFLNAIRSSKREPTYYTRNAGNTTTSTVTPAISLTDPLGKGTTTTSMIGSSTLAGATTATTGLSIALADAAKSLAPSLTLTEQNQLSLQNLDDQGSVTGLMSSVPSSMLSQYIKEGWNREELLLLFMNDMKLSAPLLKALPDAVAENCATTMIEPVPGSAPNAYCGFFFPGEVKSLYQTEENAGLIDCIQKVKVAKGDMSQLTSVQHANCLSEFDAHHVWPIRFDIPEDGKKSASGTNSAGGVGDKKGAKTTTVLAWKFVDSKSNVADQDSQWANFDFNCFQNATLAEAPRTVASAGVLSTSSAKHVRTLSITNDPALDRSDKKFIPNDFACYREVVRALLALDLGLDTNTTRKALFVVAHNDLKNNPRLLADLTQQGFELAAMPDASPPKGDTPSTDTSRDIAVCKKSDDLGFKLEGDDYVKNKLGLKPPPTKSVARGGAGESSKFDLQIQSSDYGLFFEPRNEASEEDEANISPCVKEAQNWLQPSPESKDGNTVTFTPRSLEGMVYFVGQVIRRAVDEKAKRMPVTFLNGADPSGSYEEVLFAVDTGIPSVDNFVNITHERTIYYVPGICEAMPEELESLPNELKRREECSIEFPNHAGPQVLTLLAQIWGLEKTATTLPPVPTVTLISPP